MSSEDAGRQIDHELESVQIEGASWGHGRTVTDTRCVFFRAHAILSRGGARQRERSGPRQRRTVSSRGLDRDQSGNGQPCSGAVLQQAGTAEQWIKEGKQAVKVTRLSCHRFRSNEVRLWLSLIAYNLGNLWRRLVLPKKIENWSLTSLQQRLAKTGGRLIKRARYYWLMLAESHLTRRLFGSMVGRIDALAAPTG
jgi:hypothetical protein